MARVYMNRIAQKIMTPDLQCMYHCYQFQIMCGIIFLVPAECSGSISNHSLILHKDAA